MASVAIKRKARRARRTPAAHVDNGTARAQALQARFGIYWADALGRAYVSGLLGGDAAARAMLDTGRKMATIYRDRFEHGRIRCALAPRGGGRPEDVERTREEDRWLARRLNAVRLLGPEVARAFSQLVLHPNADSGPEWLDRLLAAADTGMVNSPDLSRLAAALEGLEAAL